MGQWITIWNLLMGENDAKVCVPVLFCMFCFVCYFPPVFVDPHRNLV